MNKYVITALNSLRNNQKIFCSEKHLQMCFCQEIIKKYRNYQCIPEYPTRERKSRGHIDLVVIDSKGTKAAFEFKYITCKYSTTYKGIDYKLRNHSANDIRRYDCLKDINRLEKLKNNGIINEGYFLLVTNEKAFYDPRRSKKKTNDYKFHFENGIRNGRKAWKKGTAVGTNKGRIPFYIKHDYSVDYNDYSCLKGRKNNVFKYLLIEIK